MGVLEGERGGEEVCEMGVLIGGNMQTSGLHMELTPIEAGAQGRPGF